MGYVRDLQENFNGYFWVGDDGGANPPEGYEELFPRYGIGGKVFGDIWGGVDARWRADLNPGRTNTYGWNVEVDPFDPTSKPVKRTSTGQVVCHMGDDERFDYLYKYVSDDNWESMFADGEHPLDHGTLYVARFHDNGTGEWIPLVHGEGPLTAANGFESQADVLIKTRLAGDPVEATPMERPEWTAVHPQTGEVFATMTNNSRRRKRNAATTFDWDWFLFDGDGTAALLDRRHHQG